MTTKVKRNAEKHGGEAAVVAIRDGSTLRGLAVSRTL